MKRILFVMSVLLAGASFASAQIGAAPANDVLGAHLNYGRGCAGCHAPHSGAWGNGANKSGDTTAGTYALWGEDVGNLYGKTLNFGDSGKYVEVLPSSLTAGTSETSGLLLCLSCHDGNYAEGAMMRNAVYEQLPATYGTYDVPPTLLGKDGDGTGQYMNDHPVGAEATVGCGGQYNWDCTISGAKVLMNGPNSSRFVNNYGFFVSLGSNAAGAPIVVCTTCHNQHLMNVVSVTNNPVTFTTNPSTGVTSPTLPSGTATGLPTGYYSTMFFIRAPYNPADGNPYSNQTAQFCRQCHGGEANESNNGQAGTVF